MNAILRLHYQIEPEALATEKWSQLFQEWSYIEHQKMKVQEIVFKKALAEVLSAAFGKKKP